MQRLILLAALLGCFAFMFAFAAGRASPASSSPPLLFSSSLPSPTPPFEFYQIGESKLLVIQNERPLTDAELEALIRKLNSSPFLLP